ncbi:MAG TPA: hypothetical protein VFG25_02945, partial [Nitrosopumilaceae archaeon]|nr:hypothetical protein [Nitrosopumilaceae archaeon]
MAKIKLRFGENEVEIESRDFYIDNETLGQVIDSVTRYIQENKARVEINDQPIENFNKNTDVDGSVENALDSLEDAEIHEPEFTNPVSIPVSEIKNKLAILEKNSFFNSPRTVTETVEQLREYGWATKPFDVSKVLTKMAFSNEISKASKE